MPRLKLKIGLVLLLGFATAWAGRDIALADATRAGWLGAWASAPQLTEPKNLPPEPGFSDTTLRQIVRLSVGGSQLRVRFSNAFGNEALHLHAAHVALASAPGDSAIDPASDRMLTFHGAAEVEVPVGAFIISDPVDLPVGAFADLAVTLYVKGAPSDITSHPGSRTTSYLQRGAAVAAASLPEAVPTDHWYFLCGVDVWTQAPRGAVAILGDSLTDGRGSTTNGNDRWPDQFARRLHADSRTAGIAVLNQGIGGNRLLRDNLGPSVLARLDRDVIAQAGVRWLIVFEGINDLGTAATARSRGEPAATASDIIAAYEQIILRAHAHGIRVYGATITACGGSFYENPQSEADRQTINTWIRTSGKFDAVFDFDAATRDPAAPARLAENLHDGDHLHFNPAGYKALAEAIDLGLFAE